MKTKIYRLTIAFNGGAPYRKDFDNKDLLDVYMRGLRENNPGAFSVAVVQTIATDKAEG